MKRLFTLFFVVSVLSATMWAADVSYTEVFSKIGNLNNGTSDVYGDLCTWHRTLASHRAQDTILVKTRRAFMLPVAYTGKGKLETTDWEGGIKSVEFKFGRFGNENTNGRVLQLNVKAGTIENPTATYAKSAMKLSTGATPEGYETYSYAFNCKEQDAQLVIDNISTHAETLAENSSLCRILVADIIITPYILYRQKEVTIGTKQQGYVNKEFLDNSGGETLTYSSSNTSIATVDAETGVVTPVSAGDVLIYAALAEGARTHYTLHVVNGIVAENFSKVVQPKQATDATWHGDLFDWKADAARRGEYDTIKGRPIDRQQATWLYKEGYIESSAVIEGGVKNVSFTWRQWSAKATSTTTKVAVSYGGEVKAYQEFTEMAVNVNKSFNEDISGGNANAVLKISNLSYNGTGTVNNRIVIENVKITPWVLYTDKEMKTIHVGENYTNTSLIDNTSGAAEYESSDDAIATVDEYGQVTGVGEGYVTITAKYNNATTTYPMYIAPATNSETFSGESTAATYGTHTNVPEDATTWNTRLGGINYNENFAPNVVFLRAPKDDDTKLGYIESGLLDGGISKLTFYWNLVGNEPDVNKWDIRVLINGREVKRLTNDSGKELDGVSTRQANMTKCVIEDIDEPGRFTIRFENRSTMTGAYTSGNKARFVIDNLFWENHDAPIVLDEGVDNSALLTRNNGSTQDVNTNRTLVGGAWNTLCLPFNIDKTDLGEGVNVQTLDNASIEGDVLSIGFAALAGSTLTAGTPYLVKPESDVNLTGFTDKSIVSMNGVTSVGGGLVILQGIFSPTELTGGDRSVLFVGVEDTNGDNLFYPSVTANLNGMRAYFKVNEAMGAPIRHARFVTDQTNTATGSEEVRSETVGSVRSEKILENGQLVIIRDGVRYDVLGRKK